MVVERNMLQAQLQLRAQQWQLSVEEQEFLRVKNLRMQRAVATANAILGRVLFHPELALRYIGEAQQVLELEVSDQPPSGLGWKNSIPPPILHYDFEQTYVFISAFNFSKLQQDFKVSNSRLQT